LNVFTQKNIADSGRFPEGLGMAPWECMPQGEQCAVAQKLVKSFMGRLIPLCRFVLFKEEGLHYTEGIAHPSHKEGVVDSTITVDFSKKDAKALWVDTAKKPWRQLPALLSFLDVEAKSTFDCLQLRVGVPRAKEAVESFAIWTGGLKVSSNAGEQYTTGTDDYVESEISFETAMFGETWFVLFKAEMAALEMVADTLRKSVKRYYSLLKADGAKAADKAVALFWQMCERHLQLLVEACGDKQGDSLTPLKNRLHGYSYKVFDTACPRESARQLDAWAGARPSPEKF
jgi:CRISPR system Cascade subunit CasA